LPGEDFERGRLVKQSDVNAAVVIAVGHDIFVSGPPEDSLLGKMGEYAVILDFHQCDKISRALLTDGDNFLADVLKFIPITLSAPPFHRGRQKQSVVF